MASITESAYERFLKGWTSEKNGSSEERESKLPILGVRRGPHRAGDYVDGFYRGPKSTDGRDIRNLDGYTPAEQDELDSQ